MMRVGGGGNDPAFVRWLMVRIFLAIAWGVLTYWPRRAWRALKNRADAMIRASHRP